MIDFTMPRSIFPRLASPQAHLQNTLLASAGYLALQLLTERIAPLMFPATWKRLNRKQRVDWVSKTVSTFNAIILIYLSLSFILSPASPYNSSFSPLNPSSKAFNPLFATSPSLHKILEQACGYFVWDVVDAVRMGGGAFLLHGIACLSVYGFSFTPFCAFYGPIFLLFELSTPFLNLRWFMDKLGYEKSHPYLMKFNDAVFVLSFGASRILWGTWQSIEFWKQMISNYERIPTHLFLIYASSNVALNTLNYYWYYKILHRAIKGPNAHTSTGGSTYDSGSGSRAINESKSMGKGKSKRR